MSSPETAISQCLNSDQAESVEYSKSCVSECLSNNQADSVDVPESAIDYFESSLPECLNDNQGDSSDIPAYTEVPLTTNKIKKLRLQKFAAKRIVNLYISHLLDTDKVKHDSTLEKHFVIGNIVFRNIKVRGILTEVQSLIFKTKNRTLLSVDDGTAVLDCYAEPNQMLENLRFEVRDKLEDTKQFAVLEPSNILVKAAFSMLHSSQDLLEKLPHYRNFRVGDTVEIIGSLSEYNSKRACFISSIIKDPSVTLNIRYLENLDTFYKMFNL